MGLSPGENPATYRDREIVRKLTPLYEKQVVREARTLCPQGAAETREAIELHMRRAEIAEGRPFVPHFGTDHVEVTDGRRTIGHDDVLRPF